MLREIIIMGIVLGIIMGIAAPIITAAANVTLTFNYTLGSILYLNNESQILNLSFDVGESSEHVDLRIPTTTTITHTVYVGGVSDNPFDAWKIVVNSILITLSWFIPTVALLYVLRKWGILK